MNRVTCLALAMLSITAALPAAAQDSGGLRLRNNPLATLDLIDANRGCPLSSTGVTVGVNKAYRGREPGCPGPPAQIRAGPIRALGSYLGCLTAKRTEGQG